MILSVYSSSTWEGEVGEWKLGASLGYIVIIYQKKTKRRKGKTESVLNSR